MEPHRDPIRLALVLFGTVLLMFIIDYGINMNVEDLSWAVLDHDQTTTNQACAPSIAGSRYFVKHAPITDPDDLDRHLRSGELNLAAEIPPNFGRDLKRGSDLATGVWIDGAMLTRANITLGYVQGLHTSYLANFSRQVGGAEASAAASTEVYCRYNPDAESLKAVVPAVIPLLLIMIPAMLIALGVVHEKELGSITNLYVTPVTRLEFLAGKQLPYVAMGMINFLLMLALAIVIFRVPLKGSFLVLIIGALLYVITNTGFGLLLSTFMYSRIAVVFGVAIAITIPVIQFSRLAHPVSSLEGAVVWTGKLYPTSYFLVVSHGAFSKSLGLSDLWAYYLPLAASIVALTLLSVAHLKKQEDRATRNLANIFNLSIKEFYSLGRDYAMLALTVWAFTLGVYSSVTGIPRTLHHTPITVVDEDRSQLSSRVVNAPQPPYFRPSEMIEHAKMDHGMDVGLYTFTLNVPPGFQRDALAGRKPSIQVNVDVTQAGQASSGAGCIQNIVATEVRESVSRYRAESSTPAQVEVRTESNPSLAQAWFGGVTEVINQITMLPIILTGAALIRRHEHSTVEHLLVMPLLAFEIMTAKAWLTGLVVLVAAGLSLQRMVRGWLDVLISGSVGLFLLGVGLHPFVTISVDMFLGTVVRSTPRLGLLTILVLLLLNILSGGSTPRESMSELVQNIMLAALTTHFVSLAQAILFRGADFDIVWPQFVGIAAIGSMFFLGTLWRFRRIISQVA